jgi:3-oxoacyl-[acyl-carrier-protein] synthase-1
MVSALGLDWHTSCAASRAGTFRAEAVEYFKVQARDPWEIDGLVGHRVTLLTYGYEAYGRFIRLLAGALADLVRQGLAPSEECSLYLALPDIKAPPPEADESEEEEGDPADEVFQIGMDEHWQKTERWEQVVQSSAALAKWPGRLRLASASFDGPSGWLRLVQRHQSETAPGPAIIAAVDSLLEEAQLLQLHAEKRLKTTADPVGLMPGEAAVAFLLDGRLKSKAEIGTIGFAPAESTEQSYSPESGSRLAQLIEQTGVLVGWPGDGPPWIFSDQNGEAVRGQLWGSAVHRLNRTVAFREAELWHPAASFGDTGVASPAVAVAMAMGAWARGYEVGETCCVVAAGSAEARAVTMVRKAHV